MSGPVRIWINPCHPCTEPDDYYVRHPDYVGLSSIGYIRHDIHEEAVKALREINVGVGWAAQIARAALIEALEAIGRGDYHRMPAGNTAQTMAQSALASYRAITP